MPLTATLSRAVRTLLERQRDSQESLLWISSISRSENPTEDFKPLDPGWWRYKAASSLESISVPAVSIAVQMLSKKILSPSPSANQNGTSASSMVR